MNNLVGTRYWGWGGGKARENKTDRSSKSDGKGGVFVVMEQS